MEKNITGLLFICICMVLVSCSKEEAADKKIYYGNVQGEIKNLPGTPGMDIYINNDKVLTMESGGLFGLAGSLPVIAEEPVILEFKKKDTDTLLIDTTFTITRGETAGFKIAYSETFGIKGFVQPTPVAADSVSIQFINSLSDEIIPAGGLDLYVCKYDMFTGEIFDTLAIVPNFEKGKPVPALTFPAADPNNPSFMYIGMLKDRQTGEFILNPALGLNFFMVLSDWAYYPGKFCIGVVYDEWEYISTNLIDL